MMYLGKDPVAIAKETGAQFVKGTFTVPNDADSYTIQFGKTISKYLFLIEMTDGSKSALINSGQSGLKTYSAQGIYPIPAINNVSPSNLAALYERYDPSNNDKSVSISTSIITDIDDESITLYTRGYAYGTSFYRGSSYNYYIVEIK